MARSTDLIELASNGDDVIVDDSDFFIGEDCVTIASFKNMGDGEGWKRSSTSGHLRECLTSVQA